MNRSRSRNSPIAKEAVTAEPKLIQDQGDISEFLEIEKMSNADPNDKVKGKYRSLLSKRLHEEFVNNTKDVANDSLFAGKIAEDLLGED